MILKAQGFAGWLDISGPEILGNAHTPEWLGEVAQFRRSLKAGDSIYVPDEYYQFPNIKNAIGAGLLAIMSFDTRPDQIVVHAEIGGNAHPGTKYILLDIHGGEDTAEIREVNGIPYLFFHRGCKDRSKWNVSVPEDYQAGTPIYVNVFSTSAATGNVNWIMQYKHVGPGGAITGPMGQASYVQTLAVANNLYTTGTNLQIPSAGIVPGMLLTVSVQRQGGDPSDTLNGIVRVHMVRVDYTGMVVTP